VSEPGAGWVDVEEVPHPDNGRPIRRGHSVMLTPDPGKASKKGKWRVTRIQQRDEVAQVEVVSERVKGSGQCRVLRVERVQAASVPRPRRSPEPRSSRRGSGA
jgi:hypothetical protein